MKLRASHPGVWLVLVPLGAGVAHQQLGISLRPHGTLAWVLLLIAYPLLEEVVLRPGLQQWLHRRLGSTAAISLATLAFALMHWPRAGAWALLWLAPGLLLALLWRERSSLAQNILAHSYLNAVLVVVSFF